MPIGIDAGRDLADGTSGFVAFVAPHPPRMQSMQRMQRKRTGDELPRKAHALVDYA